MRALFGGSRPPNTIINWPYSRGKGRENLVDCLEGLCSSNNQGLALFLL